MEVLTNPDIQNAVRFQGFKNQLGSQLAVALMDTKPWADMDKTERKLCVKYVVSQVESEEELHERLRTDFGLSYVAISWHLPDPDDKTGQEALMFVRALGGLVSKNGAMVMIMTMDDSF